MALQMPDSDLSRATSHEREQDWPDEMRVVAQWTLPGGKRKSKHFIISRDEFFGLRQFGAPISGDQLLHRIDNLRRTKP